LAEVDQVSEDTNVSKWILGCETQRTEAVGEHVAIDPRVIGGNRFIGPHVRGVDIV
jgi:hypothetical protein